MCRIDNLKTLRVKEYRPRVNEDFIIVDDSSWIFCIARVRSKSSTFYWSTHVLLNVRENHVLRNTGSIMNIDAIQIRQTTPNRIEISGNYNSGSGDSELDLLKVFYLT